MRTLIVNADDLGQAAGVNRGIAEAHERGIVTSASLMVRFPAAEEGAAYARRHPELSVGLHVDLGEAEYRDGEWRSIYEVAAETPAEVEEEIRRQLGEFRRLVGADPTHFDSHQHAHRDEPARSVVLALGREQGVPVRGFSAAVTHRGDFYGQGRDADSHPEWIGVDALVALLRSLPAGVTELGCHPGYRDGLVSMYAEERERELESLCDPRVRAVLEEEGVELRSFRDAL